MSFIVKAFETYTCDRCNRKETQMREVMNGRTLKTAPYLAGWRVIGQRDLCPDCTKIVEDVIGGRP